jgi:hypothetical protein
VSDTRFETEEAFFEVGAKIGQLDELFENIGARVAHFFAPFQN